MSIAVNVCRSVVKYTADENQLIGLWNSEGNFQFTCLKNVQITHFWIFSLLVEIYVQITFLLVELRRLYCVFWCVWSFSVWLCKDCVCWDVTFFFLFSQPIVLFEFLSHKHCNVFVGNFELFEESPVSQTFSCLCDLASDWLCQRLLGLKMLGGGGGGVPAVSVSPRKQILQLWWVKNKQRASFFCWFTSTHNCMLPLCIYSWSLYLCQLVETIRGSVETSAGLFRLRKCGTVDLCDWEWGAGGCSETKEHLMRLSRHCARRW